MKGSLPDIRFKVDCSFLPVFEQYCYILCLYSFRWETHCHSIGVALQVMYYFPLFLLRLFVKINSYWNIVDLQCCVSFCCWAEWISLHTCMCYSFSCVPLFAIPWTLACQASLSMGFSRQEYWSEQPFPSTRNLPNPGFKPRSPSLQADSLPSQIHSFLRT